MTSCFFCLGWPQAAVLFELHIYTMGNHSYAKEMARILDHSGALFSGRIIAKGDDAQVASMSGFERDEFGPPHHKDMDGVLGMESTALIVDDSAGVWPHHSTNLIVVERYSIRPSSFGRFRYENPSKPFLGWNQSSRGDRCEVDDTPQSTLPSYITQIIS